MGEQFPDVILNCLQAQTCSVRPRYVVVLNGNNISDIAKFPSFPGLRSAPLKAALQFL